MAILVRNFQFRVVRMAASLESVYSVDLFVEPCQGRGKFVNLGRSPRQVGDLLFDHLEEVVAPVVEVEGGSEVSDQARH